MPLNIFLSQRLTGVLRHHNLVQLEMGGANQDPWSLLTCHDQPGPDVVYIYTYVRVHTWCCSHGYLWLCNAVYIYTWLYMVRYVMIRDDM